MPSPFHATPTVAPPAGVAPLLTRQEAAMMLGIGVRTLDAIPDLPRIRVSPRTVRFDVADLQRWLETRKPRHARPAA